MLPDNADADDVDDKKQKKNGKLTRFYGETTTNSKCFRILQPSPHTHHCNHFATVKIILIKLCITDNLCVRVCGYEGD